VQVDTAAVNTVATRPIARTAIPVANVRGAYTPAVAEFTLGLILTLTRRLRKCSALQREGKWVEDYASVQGENCYGKTMGIVGYGSIGRHLARIAQAMGMSILACKRNPEIRKDTGYQPPNTGDPKGVIPSAWFGVDQVERMFADCDFAVVTLPYTPETKGLIGRKQLEALRPHAYVVNVGRGGVVDEAALAELLAAGRLAGAGLDVFANEPLEPSSPLWKMENVIIAPHVASYTRDQNHLAAEVLIENLTRELAKKPLVNVVDLKRGY
jgi:phosphoglycerate dehydrogenase-like enzyme